MSPSVPPSVMARDSSFVIRSNRTARDETSITMYINIANPPPPIIGIILVSLLQQIHEFLAIIQYFEMSLHLASTTTITKPLSWSGLFHCRYINQ